MVRSIAAAAAVFALSASLALAAQDPDTVKLKFDSTESGDPGLTPANDHIEWIAITPNGREIALYWVELRGLEDGDVLHWNGEAQITNCRQGPDFDPNGDGYCIGTVKHGDGFAPDIESKVILTDKFNENAGRPSLNGETLSPYEEPCSYGPEAHCVHTRRGTDPVGAASHQWLVMVARGRHPSTSECRSRRGHGCTVATLDGQGALNAFVERGDGDPRSVSRTKTKPPEAIPVSSQDSEDDRKRRVIYSADLGKTKDLVGDLIDAKGVLAIRHSLPLNTSPSVNSFLLLTDRPKVKNPDHGVRISVPNGQNCEPNQNCDHPNYGTCVISKRDVKRGYRYVNLVASAGRHSAPESAAVGVRGDDGSLSVDVYDDPRVVGDSKQPDACKS